MPRIFSYSLLTIALSLFAPATPFAQPLGEDETEQLDPDAAFVIDAVLIEGLFRTKAHVVMRELLFAEGERVSVREIEESVQRLRNLGLFRIAEYELLDRRIPLPDGSVTDTHEQHRILLITVDERWTIIPFGTFSSGGGTFSLTTGLYDINVLGRYLELGGQYQRFANTDSFALWASDPRFLGERLSLAATVAQTNRTQVFYNDGGAVEGAHRRTRRSVSVGMGREWLRWFSTGVGLSYVDDSFSVEGLNEDLAELERARGIPEAAHFLSGSLAASVGRIDANSYLREGARLSGSAGGSAAGLASNHPHADLTLSGTAFAVLPFKTNVGVRLGVGTTTTDRPEYQYFLGGFNIIRGFLHRRFYGPAYWFGNAELRIPSLDTRWIALQHVAFFDAAAAGARDTFITELDGASVGIGLRFLSPKVYSLLGRIDYAWPVYGDGGSALSFGAGQFF